MEQTTEQEGLAHLKCLFKSSHPQIWKFVDTFDKAIAYYDNEISRLEQGKEITRSRKIHARVNIVEKSL